jgi:acetyl esterase/lipase
MPRVRPAATWAFTQPKRRTNVVRSIIRGGIITSLTVAFFFVGIMMLLRFDVITTKAISSLFGDWGPSVESDIAYVDDTNPRHRLDVYRPPSGTSERDAIIVFLYGGSWTSGDRGTYAFVGQALAARGYTTVIPDYRLYPEVQFPKFVEDAAAAYAWTERNLARSCTPARPIIVAGHSAGAHMAAQLAFDRRFIASQNPAATPPAALIGLAGPYTFEPTTWPSTRDAFASVSATPDVARPITFVKPGDPPALLVHGLADDLVNLKNTRELAAALTAIGTRVDTAEYENIGHIGLVLTLSKFFRWRAPTLDNIDQFARTFSRTHEEIATCASR